MDYIICSITGFIAGIFVGLLISVYVWEWLCKKEDEKSQELKRKRKQLHYIKKVRKKY